ncbi:hypothetical protein GGI09_002058 [Coemansia sp. S100]|nr:hypothetical protein GGI09_002058 [Coemansia sp. S100]
MAATLELGQTLLGNSTDTKAGYSLPTSSESLAASSGALVSSSVTVVDRGGTEQTRESAATLSMPSVDGIVGIPLVAATAMGDNVRHGRMAVAGDGCQQKYEQSVVSSSHKDCNECCAPGIVSQEVAYDLPSDIDKDNERNNIAGAKRLADRNYADRFGSYYEYSAAIVEDDKSALESPARADHMRLLLPRQRRQNGVPAHRSPPHLPLPKVPPPLRSTYKSEPVMQGRGDLCDPRNSYSQTLENALFYSQAIRQIRETDCVDASDPYAVAVPRARPGKEDIRQRRARNVIASREVFSITTPSAFIPLPSAGKNGAGGMWALEAMPKLPSSIERSLAMRSEPAIKLAAGKQKSGNGTAVPITRMLPPTITARSVVVEDGGVALASNNTPTTSSGFFSKSYDHNGVGRGGDAQETAWEAARRAGIDQPLPTAAEFAEGLKQRGVNMPRTAASSIITSRSVQLRQRQRPYSTAESAVVVFGSDEEEDDEEDGEYVAVPGGKRTSIMTQTSRTQFRLSMASHFSLASGVDHPPQPEAQPEQQQGGRTQVSSHSRQVATRLLMRAGFSSIAIRVARLGRAPAVAAMAASTLTRSHGALIAGAESDAEESDAGVDLDPNGLQTLRAERRKQVKRIDEYGFLQFEGDEERPSEYAQQYEAWRGRRARGRSRAGGLLSDEPRLVAGSEAKWETLLRSFDNATLRGSRKVKQLVQAGVPARMRAQVYYAMSGASKLERGDEYARLLALEPVAIFDVIERDVARCYPDHAMFSDAEGVGQRQLRRILRAYAQYNNSVGYCQGMGRLVGLFLIVGLSEEQAFWVLAATIANYIPQYYVPDLCGLRVHTAVFEALLAERSPRLHAHLADEGCDALMYATPWFMTVFTLSLPWPAALRVWDWFMFRGTKVLFRVALAITDLAAAYLLEACPSITELLGFLLHIPHSLVDADTLIAAAAKVKISERHIDRLTSRLSARLNK